MPTDGTAKLYGMTVASTVMRHLVVSAFMYIWNQQLNGKIVYTCIHLSINTLLIAILLGHR